jgi:hypothetical protein
MDGLPTTGFTRCRFAVARRDITAPIGIYARAWGAARHDTAAGVHRPLTATAAWIAPLDDAAGRSALAIVAVDLGNLPDRRTTETLRRTILAATGLPDEALLLSMSHTHAGPRVNPQQADRPGGELIVPYLEQLTAAIVAALLEARDAARPAWLTAGYGRCSLAAERDFWAPDLGRYVCGYNPHGAADDTVAVVRVTDDDARVLATFVNYACHPTTLAWENQLLSPDYVGAMREVLEQIYAAPCLFLYGAGGELGPREGFVGDPAVADRNGRQLGYAAAAAIEALPPAATRFCYNGTVASGANLATWVHQPLDPAAEQRAAVLSARQVSVALARKPALTPVDAPRGDAGDPVAEAEKAARRASMREALGDEPFYAMPLWCWRLGDLLLLAAPNEAYSIQQIALRRRFAGRPVLVLGTTNGTTGYLPPAELYGSGRYQEQQSPFLPGCLEQTIEAAIHTLEQL